MQTATLAATLTIPQALAIIRRVNDAEIVRVHAEDDMLRFSVHLVRAGRDVCETSHCVHIDCWATHLRPDGPEKRKNDQVQARAMADLEAGGLVLGASKARIGHGVFDRVIVANVLNIAA